MPCRFLAPRYLPELVCGLAGAETTLKARTGRSGEKAPLQSVPRQKVGRSLVARWQHGEADCNRVGARKSTHREGEGHRPVRCAQTRGRTSEMPCAPSTRRISFGSCPWPHALELALTCLEVDVAIWHTAGCFCFVSRISVAWVFFRGASSCDSFLWRGCASSPCRSFFCCS